MKTIFSALLLFSVSLNTFAHENNDFNNACNIELQGGVRIEQNTINFVKDNELIYKIIDDNQLVINNRTVDLDEKQQQLVQAYAHSIRAVVPKVKHVALEAVDLAVEGVSLAFNELLGENNQTVEKLTTELAKVRSEVDDYFGESKPVYLGKDDGRSDEVFAKQFEERVENLIEEVVQNSIGTLLVAIGQEMLTSGDDIDAFEAKMDKFGERIEQEMQIKTQQVEHKMEGLCHAVSHIDHLEEQLKKQIPALAHIDLLTVTVNKG